ncbi:hypothetical protein EDB85DRAFT_2153746 [Lactarius pseudohatsudake]|nr:hypothetical protein EDB85DRAFT_2153746 [Lactarius pseudohatsudake]
MTRGGKTTDKLHYHLGSIEEHTVFEAELVGILLGLQLIKLNRKGNLTYTIGVDNQAAIKALSSKLNKPGHYIAAEALSMAAKIRKERGKKYALTVRWTAGHTGIEGNEEADEEAKKVAEGTSSPASLLPTLLKKGIKTSKSAVKQALHAKRKTKWREEWEKSTRYEKTKRFDPSLPSRKFIELISNKKLSRAMASKMFQLRTGHIPLNAYLHRFKRMGQFSISSGDHRRGWKHLSALGLKYYFLTAFFIPGYSLILQHTLAFSNPSSVSAHFYLFPVFASIHPRSPVFSDPQATSATCLAALEPRTLKLHSLCFPLQPISAHRGSDPNKQDPQRDSVMPFQDLPPRHEESAPILDLSDPCELWRYFDDIEFLFLKHRVSDPQEKKRTAVNYPSIAVEWLWRTARTFSDPAHSYKDFKAEVVALYPEAIAAQEHTLAKLDELVAHRDSL